MVQRVISNRTSNPDWATIRDSVQTPDDAVIVRTDGQPDVVVISYDRYEQLIVRERQERSARSREAWDELVALAGDRNSDLTPEFIENMAQRDWEEPETLDSSGITTRRPSSGSTRH